MTPRSGRSCERSLKTRPRWGYRRAHHHLQRAGLGGEPQAGAAPLARGRPTRAPAQAQTPPAGRIDRSRHGGWSPSGPGHVWAFDFQADQTADGRMVRLCNIVDEYTREALVMHVRAQHRRRHRCGPAGGPGRRARRPGAPADGQRTGDDRSRSGGLVHPERDGDGVHRPGIAVAEPVRRELPRPGPGRVARRRGVLRVSIEAQVVIGRLARGLQPPPAPQLARDGAPRSRSRPSTASRQPRSCPLAEPRPRAGRCFPA